MEDMYRLPFTRVYEDCKVLAEFVDHLTEEEASWNDIHLKALEIVFDCVQSVGVGGVGLVGQLDRIRVSVQYYHQVA